MLTIWGRKSSFNLQKVMWLVGELQLVHRTQSLSILISRQSRCVSSNASNPSQPVMMMAS
jgi:hypothetical protein